MTPRYDALQEFFLSYFHPDWRLDAGSRGEVVGEFLRSESDLAAQNVINDLRELLREPVEEDRLHEMVLQDYSLCYDPWKDEITMREWLEGLVRELEAPT